MYDGYLKIPFARLIARRRFARAVFLAMPRNRKLLRVVAADGELSKEILDRLSKGGGHELYVKPEPGDPEDPETFPLYFEESAEPAPQVQGAPLGETFGEAADPASPAGQILSRDAGEPEAETRLGANRDEAESTELASSAAEEEAAQPFGAEDPQALEETSVSGAVAEPELVRRFSADKREPEDEFEMVVKPGEAPPARKKTLEQDDAAPPAANGAEESFSSASSGASDVRHFASDATEEEATAFRSSEAIAELSLQLQTIGRDLSSQIQQFQEAAEASGEEKLTRLGSMLDSAGEAFQIFSRASDPTKDTALPGLARTLENCLSAVDALAASDDAAAVLSASPGLRDALGHASGAVTNTLSPAERESLAAHKGTAKQDIWVFSADPNAPEETTTLAAGEASPAADATVTTLGELTYRETPQIAGRLAAILGHSLGYSSLEFLTDLALSAMVLFSKKAGAQIQDDALSPLSRAALTRSLQFSEGVFEDSLWILEFLEAYFQNPECDRTLREFSKRAFESTLDALEVTEQKPDSSVAARWRQFIGRGPTIAALSVSSKASSRASRAAKDLILEMPTG